MIYLASPYTHDNPLIRKARFVAVQAFVAEQLRNGVVLFSPIVYCHQFATEYGLPISHEPWVPFNKQLLEFAEELWVFPLPGWEKSKGVALEIELAKQLGKTVYYCSAP